MQNRSDIPAYNITQEKCVGCGHCKHACKFRAISGSHRQSHQLDPAKCMHCGRCMKVCRHGAIKAII